MMRASNKRILILTMTALLAFSTTRSSAQERDDAPPERRRGQGFNRDGMGRNRFRPPTFEAPTPEEWEKISSFVKQHSPRRIDVMEGLSPELQDRVKGLMTWRYRSLERLKQDDPETYDLRLKRLGIEDEIFGIGIDLSDADGEKRTALIERRKEFVASLVDLGFAERAIKITRIKQMLSREEEQLQTDKTRRDQMIEDRTHALEQERGIPLLGSIEERPPRPREGPRDGPPEPPPDQTALPQPTTEPSNQ